MDSQRAQVLQYKTNLIALGAVYKGFKVLVKGSQRAQTKLADGLNEGTVKPPYSTTTATHQRLQKIK